MGDWEEIIKAALPAIAGFYAGHQGQLGPYSQGLMQSQHMMDQTNLQRSHQAQQESWHQEQIRQQNIDNDRQQQAVDANIENHRIIQEAAQAEAARHERERQTAHVQKYFDNAAADYGTTDLVNKFGKDAFSIDVPGIGPINLQKAMEMGAIPPANFGTATPPPPKQPALIDAPGPDGSVIRAVDAPGAQVYKPAGSREPLITGVGPDGKPIRVRDEPGAQPYETPNQQKEPLITGIGPDGKPTRVKDAPGVTPFIAPSSQRDPLINIIGPDGMPIRGRDIPGARPYVAADKPVKPVRHVTTYKETDPDNEEEFGKTFKVVTDENGDIISKTLVTPGEIKNGKSVAPAAPATPAGKRIGRFEIISVK